MPLKGFSVTVVVPCLNEEGNVRGVVTALLRTYDRSGLDGEVIVVNDGSRDGTGRIVAEMAAADARVKLLEHGTPRGIGASFWEGVHAAEKEFVTLVPGDGEIDPDEILRYLPLLRDVDLVVPFVPNVEIRSRGRRILSSVYRFLINVAFGMNLNYTNGTVLYRLSVLKTVHLDAKGFFYQAELLVRLIRLGALYGEVPYYLRPRKDGKTKAVSIRSLKEVMRGFVKLAWDVHVLRRAGRLDAAVLPPDSMTFKRLAESKAILP